MKTRKIRRYLTTSRYYILFIIFLVLANTTLSVMLSLQAGQAMKTQVQGRMLDIANTAAAMLDGDTLRNITAEDKGTPGYEEVYNSLAYFRDNIELDYIFCIIDRGDKNFVFGIDPSLDSPGEFGSPVVYTDALYRASKGMASVDEEPYTDAWGTFYSAYSPVFDSFGKVAGIVAVDFSKEWYDRPIITLVTTSVIITVVSLALAAIMVIMLTSRNRSRISIVNGQLNELADNFDKLMREVRNMSGGSSAEETSRKEEETSDSAGDDIDAIRMKILALQDELYKQIENVQEQAFIDGMTGVRNKAAYLRTEKNINEAIARGDAAFSVVVFDLNGLKAINDSMGHQYGDMAIIDSTKALVSVYDRSEIYRIGGDEFIVILNTGSEPEVQNSISRLEYRLAADNTAEKPYKKPLALSMGYAVYDPGIDKEYREVFQRADKNMYDDKASYYRTHGDRRHRD